MFDRQSAFIVDDNPQLEPEAFSASKSVTSQNSLMENRKVTAVAIREHGTEKFSKVLRFMYSVPDGVNNHFNRWVAVTKPGLELNHNLFGDKKQYGAVEEMMKCAGEKVVENCNVLTVGQRCADWFILRQFRLTGTNSGNILLQSNFIRTAFNLTETTILLKTEQEQFDNLIKGWFSSKVSTETMKRGSVNEAAVMDSLRATELVIGLFEVGLVSMKEVPYLACSPDGIAILRIESMQFENSTPEGEGCGKNYCLASVEIKTRVSARTLGQSMEFTSADPVSCEVGDTRFRQLVPTEHTSQLLHQATVLKLSYVLYVCASETEILYIVVAKCLVEQFNVSYGVLRAVGDPLL